MAVTDTVSYSKVIRDAIFSRVIAMPTFAGWTSRKSPALQIQPQLLPYIGVYIAGEKLSADGDANVGDIRFIHALRIGFSAIIAVNDPTAAEDQLDGVYWALMNGLLRDDTLTNHLSTTLVDNVRIEGFPEGMRRHMWGNASLTNETPLAEMQFELACTYRSNFYPSVDDDLRIIDVRTGLKIGDTEEEMDERVQVHVQHQFDSEGDLIELPLAYRIIIPLWGNVVLSTTAPVVALSGS